MLSALTTLVLLAAPGVRVELIFGGDVIPHDAVKDTAKAWARTSPDDSTQSLNHLGWDHVFGPLASELRGADLAVVNLETPLTDDRRAVTEELVFAAPSALAQGLKAAGVSVATFANNHCLDQHPAGIVQTREHLQAAGLFSVGADRDEASAWQPLVVDRHGMKVCLLAFTRFLNGFHNPPGAKAPHVPLVHYWADPDVGGLTETQALEKVRAAAAQCDALIITPHWGDEYRPEPNPNDRRFAWALLEAGATAVIGSHPHVLQTVETYQRADGRQALIAYSLGNLVSNQGGEEADSPLRDGLLLRLTVELTPQGASVASARALPVWTENRLEKGKRRNVQPVLLDVERSAMQERLRQLEGRDDRVSLSEGKSLTRRLAVAEKRRARITRQLPMELYENDLPPALATQAAGSR